MKSWLEELNLGRKLQEGLADQREALRAQAGSRELRETADLLEKDRELLRQLQGLLSGNDSDPAVRAALERAAALQAAERRKTGLRGRADAIYNAYYTHDGIRNGLIALEEYAGGDAEDIDDAETLYMKLYTDRLRIVRFLYDRAAARAAEAAEEAGAAAPPAGPLTEEALVSLGWIPVEARLRADIARLRAYMERGKQPSAERAAGLRELGNAWEENREILRRNLLRLKGPAPARAEEEGAEQEEERLLAAMTRVMTGEAFEAMSRKPESAEAFRLAAAAFLAQARAELLDPFDRT